MAKVAFFNFSYTDTHKIFSVGKNSFIRLKFKLNTKELKKRRILNLKENNNIISLVKENGEIEYYPDLLNIQIEFYGKNNVVELHEPLSTFSNCRIILQDNSSVKILKQQEHQIANLYIFARYSTGINISIGENCSINQLNIEATRSKDLICQIGNNCMISSDTMLRLHDAHTIYDVNTKLPLNKPSKGIVIGDNCWISQFVKILKDVEIPASSIIGIGSIVTKSFEKENTIIAGIPAKIVRENIAWDRLNVFSYEENLMRNELNV
ncbi:MAG: acyltransferase [Cyanobacteria bacterium SIG28]|nr:acyltransferase [Cyanobacteria bacterium SIG28]